MACAAFAGGLVFGGVAAVEPAANGATPAPVLTARQVADRDQPAIDLVEAETKATVTIFLPSLDINAVVNFAQNNSDIQQAVSQSDNETVARDIIQEISNNVLKYVAKGDGTSYAADIGQQGSAFTVTPDGYIVTNAHVAIVSSADAAAQFLQTLPQDQLTAIQKAFIDQFGGLTDNGTSITIPSDQSGAVDSLLGEFVGATASVAGLTTTITVFQGHQSANATGMIAKVVAAGKPFPDKDVAILKVDAQNLPTVPTGDDSLLHPGDPIYAIGYPGDATFNKDVVKTTTYSSTISGGLVSNRLQSSAADYQYIEHTATVNHGNSGGALINDAGQVVGITTASDSSTEAANGVNGGKFFYAVPASVVGAFLTSAHVVAAAAAGEAPYNQGVDLLASNKLVPARKKFLQAQKAGYNSPYLAQALVQTNSVANRLGGSSSSAGATALGGVVLLLLILGVILILIWRGRKRAGGGGVQFAGAPAGFGASTEPPAYGGAQWTTAPTVPVAPPPEPTFEPPVAPPIAPPPPPVVAPQPTPPPPPETQQPSD